MAADASQSIDGWWGNVVGQTEYGLEDLNYVYQVWTAAATVSKIGMGERRMSTYDGVCFVSVPMRGWRPRRR